MGVWQWTFELWSRIREPAITCNSRVWKCESVSQSVSLHWITVILALPAHCAVMICSGSWWLLCDQVVTINISTSGTQLKFHCLSTAAVVTCGAAVLHKAPAGRLAQHCRVGEGYWRVVVSWRKAVRVALWCTFRENTHVRCIYIYISIIIS